MNSNIKPLNRSEKEIMVLNNPRVLELCLTLETGGLERVVVTLSNALAKNGLCRPHIYTVGKTSSDLLANFIHPKVGWTELGGPPHFTFKHAVKLAGDVRSRGIDLIHAHGTQPLVYALAASALSNVPIVFTKHNSYEDLGFFTRHRLFTALARRRVKYFAGVSDQATKINQRIFQCEPDRFVTQFNGTEIPAKSLRQAAGIARSRANSNRPYTIATICRLAPEKDLVTLLNAFAEVRECAPHARLWIVGDGEERASLTELARQLGIEKYVRFWGFSARIHQILACSDLYVNSSLTEGVSVSILEAMSMGLPIVATAVGGTPSIVTHAKNGLLVPAGDVLRMSRSILSLINDRALSRSFSENSAQLAQRHGSLDTMAERYYGMYAAALDLGCKFIQPMFRRESA